MSKKNLRDSAILMMALGEDAASEVFKFLNPKEVQELGTAMAELTQLTRCDPLTSLLQCWVVALDVPDGADETRGTEGV